MRKLNEEFKHFKGQPIEVITEHMKYCGIDCDNDDDSVMLIDKKGRLVRIEFRHIEAVIEPQMRLTRLCGRDDCDCEHDEHGCDRDCGCDY